MAWADGTTGKRSGAALEASLINRQFLGSCEGVASWQYAHSYGAVTSPNANVSPGGLYFNRLKNRLALNSATVYATPGGWMLDLEQLALGTNTGTWASGKGLVVIDGVQNDMVNGGVSDAQGLQGFNYALESLLWTLLSSARVEQTDATFVDTSGTWSTTSFAQLSGGSAKFSTSTTAIQTISFTGTDCVLLLVGKDSAGGGTTGGVYQVKLDGSTIGTFNCNDACKRSTQTTASNVHISVPMLGMSNTTHTITVTNTGTAGTVVYVDALLTLTPTPPTILVMKQLFLSPYVLNGSDAAVTLYNGAIDTMLASAKFAGRPVYAVDPNTNFDTSMFSAITPRHLNDKGSSKNADNIIATLAGLGYRLGQNIGL